MGKKNSKIHVLTWGGIGDVILLTPALREIKRSSPESVLIVHAIHKKHRDVLLHNPHIDILRIESKPLVDCVRFLRKNGYLPVRYRVPSYGEYAPSLWVPPKHATEVIAELFDVQLSHSTPELFLTPTEEEFAKKALEGLKLPIAIHTRSSRIHKDWPERKWQSLVSRNPHCSFVELGVCGERILDGTVDLPSDMEVRHDFALLKHCRAFVGIESCFAHAAAALGVPGVVLFGSSSPNTWGYPSSLNLSIGLRCSPCIDIIWGNKCPYDVACMNTMTVETVEDSLRRQLALVNDLSGDGKRQ